MPAQQVTIIGRAAELAAIDEFLGLLHHGPAVLVLEGDAGIGKTTLWRQGLALATERDVRTLSCRPSEREADLAYGALGDLLVDLPSEALAALPEPQRQALDVALMRAEPDHPQLFPRAVALGFLGVLRVLAAEQPLLVAVDDAQWLDPPSERVLAFVARRLGEVAVGMLVACRPDSRAFTADLERDHVMSSNRLRRLTLASLAAAELDELLRLRLGVAASKRVLASLHRASSGNAFYALEIGRAMLQQGAPSSSSASSAFGRSGELPIPRSLQDMVHDRLSLLPGAARDVVRVASAMTRPTIALIEAAAPGSDVAAGVAAARRAGVIEDEGDRVDFVHPVLASVAYRQLSPAARQDLHGRLAALLDDPEERARHLALASEAPDAAVAEALDEAAGRARARGAPDSAAELWELAVRRTPDDARDDRDRRAIEAAERHFEAGNIERARALLDGVVASAAPGERRAHALARLGWVHAHTDGFEVGARTFEAARAEQPADVALQVEIEGALAWCIHSTRGVSAAEPHARRALALAEASGDPTLVGAALSHVAFLSSVAGRGVDLDSIERAVALAPSPAWSQILGRADWIRALLRLWSGSLVAARGEFEALHREASERGDEHSLPFILFQLARAELLAGEWQAAEAHARECQQTTLHSGQVSERPYAYAIEALVDTHLGSVDAARDEIAEGLALAAELGVRPAGLELLATRGFLELSLGEYAEAERTLDAVAGLAEQAGFGEPALYRFHGDVIETKVALGRKDEAHAAVDELDALATRLGRPGLAAIAARCRGLLRASLGDLEGAYAALAEALERHPADEPFERARTLLALGTVQRRDKKKRPARQSLEAALQTFERLGAALWVERVQGELVRIGGRPSVDGLTPTEMKVAELIAAGRTYQQVADELFISPKTVKWNLSKIYRKLGIRSRAELPSRLAAPVIDTLG